MRSLSPLPLPVLNTLRKVGADIRSARKRRRLPMALMSERAGISRSTLTKVEKGDPSVAIGIYATVLYILGLSDNLRQVADIGNDEVGRILEEENLPKRIHLPKRED